jgi:hypothetical protein
MQREMYKTYISLYLYFGQVIDLVYDKSSKFKIN